MEIQLNWKFQEYVLQMKKFILDNLNEIFNGNILDDQVKWQYVKYNVRKYIIKFSKERAKTQIKILLN